MKDTQSWFVETQERLAERVGEPVLLIIKMAYDDWFDAEIQTFGGIRFGIAAGRDLEQAIEEALEMLLELDETIAEVEARKAAEPSGKQTGRFC